MCIAAASTKAFFKGVETWKKETIIKKVALVFTIFSFVKLYTRLEIFLAHFFVPLASDIGGC